MQRKEWFKFLLFLSVVCHACVLLVLKHNSISGLWKTLVSLNFSIRLNVKFRWAAVINDFTSNAPRRSLCKLLNSISEVVGVIWVHCAHWTKAQFCVWAYVLARARLWSSWVESSQISQGWIRGSTIVADYFPCWKCRWPSRQMWAWASRMNGCMRGRSTRLCGGS